MKVYVVWEYPHGYEDEYHSILLVTADLAEAQKIADGIRYDFDEYEVEAGGE